MDPYLIITSDSHAGLPTEAYRAYLESKYHRGLREFLGERGVALEEMTNLGVRNSDFAEAWYAENGEALERRLGCAQPRPGARRRRHLRGGHFPGCGRGRVAYLRAVRRRTRPVRRHRPRARHGRRPGPQPVARRAVRAQPRAPLRRGAHPDHRRAGRGARRDPAQQGIRPRLDHDPGHVDARPALPRPALRPGLGAVRGAADAGHDPLRPDPARSTATTSAST